MVLQHANMGCRLRLSGTFLALSEIKVYQSGDATSIDL